MSFVAKHGLWSNDQQRLAADIRSRVEADGLETIRFSFPDQHGILRGKTLVADEAMRVLDSGVSLTSTLLAKDTAHRTVFPIWKAGGGFDLTEMQGGRDVVMVPDPGTFRVLPWVAKTGWILCDVHFGDGTPVPFATRHLYRQALDKLDARGLDFIAGIEVEFHLFKLTQNGMRLDQAGQPGEPPEVELTSPGYQYLTEQRFDLIEPILDILRKNLLALGLPLRSIEVEYGPSQCEFTFAPTTGLEPADLMVLFRSATKQICQRAGYHATFMCRPKIPNVVSSGWHLHQSLRERTSGTNIFTSDNDELLSARGKNYLAGLLAHARAAAVFSTPTINGYKRYAPYSLAPDRAVWASDNRGVMIRVIGSPGDPATRLENRVGEPAANPYLYMASQIHAGLDGIDRNLDPGPSADTPYDTQAPALPRSLREALDALTEGDFFKSAMGEGFVRYYAHIKNAEIDRFQSMVTDWEQREYFEIF